MAVGKVIIGTRLDTKQLEKDLKNSEKELQKYEKEAEKLTEAKAKIDIDLQEYEKQKQLIQEANEKTLKLCTTEEQRNWELDIQKRQLDELTQEYSAQIQKAEEINSKIESNAVSQSMLNDKIQETSQKLKQVKGFEQIKNEINEVNKGLTKTIKKVGKWALGIFGIRSAYNAVRSAISTLTQYDDQMASNIEYIKYALANSLQPVIQTILNLVVKLLQYINYIVKAWTGKDLFKTADAFKNAQKNAKGLNKELQKTTAGFDEINTASSQSISGTDTGGISVPDVDLTGIQGEIPGWVDWIAKNGELVKNILIGIGIAIGLIELAKLISGLETIWKIIEPLLTFIGKNAQVIGGIIMIVGGLAIAIKGVIEYLKNPTWENFGNILLGIGIIATGVLVIFGGIPALVTLIIGAVVALGLAIYKNWDKIKECTSELVEKIKNAFASAIEWIKNKFNSMISFFSNLISKIVSLFKTIGTKVGDAIGGAFKAVINGVLKAIENILNSPIRSINKLIGVINKVPGINLGNLPTFSLPRLGKGGIINQPGRGVPVGYGQAIGGEHGPEGVIPFTDSQQMALIGEAIGKYVRIDNIIDVNMDSRRINRILQSSSNRTALASNR